MPSARGVPSAKWPEWNRLARRHQFVGILVQLSTVRRESTDGIRPNTARPDKTRLMDEDFTAMNRGREPEP